MKRIYIWLPIIIFTSILFGVFLGGTNPFKAGESASSKINFLNIGKSTGSKVERVLQTIQYEYVDSVNSNDLVEKTITAMLERLDPHSYYIPASKYKDYNDPINGSFEGIGIEFRIKDDTVMVVSTIGGGPSEKVGLQAGDRIVHVDTSKIAGIGIQNKDVVKYLKGPKGSSVKVTVQRKNVEELIAFDIVRDKIPLYSVATSYNLSEDVGYIRITRFAKYTYEEFMKAAKELQSNGMKRLVLDLRGNGGGLLNAAIEISDEFLEEGKKIVYTKGDKRAQKDYIASARGMLEEMPLVVLLDENSASASEILAGAIQDNDRGVIIGRRSFGKGLVQEQKVWNDGAAIRITVARYYTPTGRCIQKPYSDGMEAYHLEAYDRYQSGELYSLDSIELVDSLKYVTPKGKVVYGGGGILPDVFIPLDTSGSSDYFYQLRYTGVLSGYALSYTDEHRKELLYQYSDATVFSNKFKVDGNILRDFISYATSKGVAYQENEWKHSRNKIEINLKASIGRNLWRDEGYFKVINSQDKVILRAQNSFEMIK